MTGTERVRMIRRPSVAGTVEPIHRVSRLYKVMHPAWAAADAHHMRALASAAMHQHDGVRVRLLGRDHVLHIHLPHGDFAVGHPLALYADPEAALVGQLDSGGLHVSIGIDPGIGRTRTERVIEPSQNGLQ